mgnify:CR=1 FL=1
MSGPFAVFQRAYRHKEGTPPGKADVIAGELLGCIVRQTVDQLLDGKIRPDGVHGGGGVGATAQRCTFLPSALGMLWEMKG